MEIAVAELIGYRNHTIVPNVSWGLGLKHECDLLVMDKKNRFTEVEIKISKSDLRADFKKDHGHRSNIISRLVYAIPEDMLSLGLELIPASCGIITVSYRPYSRKYKASWHRVPKHKKPLPKVPDSTIARFYELGCMRIWSLKQALYSKRSR